MNYAGTFSGTLIRSVLFPYTSSESIDYFIALKGWNNGLIRGGDRADEHAG